MAFPMTDIIQEDGERANKVVGFCSREQVEQGKLGLGGRRRVAAAENGWDTKHCGGGLVFHWRSV